jgi:hypothetical protein
MQRGDNPGGKRDSTPEGAEETSKDAHPSHTFDGAVFAHARVAGESTKSRMPLPPFDTRSQRKLGLAAVVQGQAEPLSQDEAT